MILTTTQILEGHTITEYMGLVFGDVVSSATFSRDTRASFRNILGGRVNAYEEGLISARSQALCELEKHANEMGAYAVIGVKIDNEVFVNASVTWMVSASGTAVKLQ